MGRNVWFQLPNFIFLQTHSLRLTTKWGRNPRHQGGDAKIFCAFAQKFRDMAGQDVKLTAILFR
ncbi:hypothetical protein AWP94_21130 [Escherichia coli]|nr:hypothetical protein AWP94_21130 [Escherichia coli]